LEDLKEEIFRPVKNKKEEGIEWQDLNIKLGRTMIDYVGFMRNEVGLKIGLKAIRRLKRDSDHLVAKDYHELMRVIEVKNLLMVGEVVCSAALSRKESRMGSSHFRADFPQRDDKNWLGLIDCKLDPSTGQPECAFRPRNNLELI
jgi:adenylylsulfate reductase subunit A